MTRYMATVESAAALGTAAPSGGTANALFANVLGMNASGGITRIRRVTLGVRAGTSAPTSQQMTVGLARTTARGTATATSAWGSAEGYTGVTNPYSPGIDTAWSAVPTGTWTAPYFWEIPFNTQATVDLPWELLEELMIQPVAAYNGLAFFNVGNAVPTAHLYAMGVEVEV